MWWWVNDEVPAGGINMDGQPEVTGSVGNDEYGQNDSADNYIEIDE